MDKAQVPVSELRKLIRRSDWKALERELSKLHPYDIGEFIHSLSEDERREVLTRLNTKLLASFISELHDNTQKDLLSLLTPRQSAEIVRTLQPDEAVDLLKLIPSEKRREILRYLPKKVQKELSLLIPLPSDTAGGLMTTKVLALPMDMTVREAEEYIRKKAEEFETIYYVYVVDEQNRLVGVLSLRDLVLAPENKKLSEIMHSPVISVGIDMDQEEVAKIVADYDLAAIPVVDEQQKLRGVITVDDIVDVIEEEIVEDLGKVAGTGEKVDQLIDAPVADVIRARLPWLFVALIGDGLVGAFVLKNFEHLLASVVALSLFVPVIMTMGGNVGLQTSTIFVRGLATKEIQGKLDYLLRELRIGVGMALIAGSAVGLFSLVVVGKPIIGLIVGIAMLCAMSLASVMGIAIPWIFHKLGIDPAIASGPFMTTTQDITSLLVYFSLASLMLKYIS